MFMKEHVRKIALRTAVRMDKVVQSKMVRHRVRQVFARLLHVIMVTMAMETNVKRTVMIIAARTLTVVLSPALVKTVNVRFDINACNLQPIVACIV